MRQHFQFVAFVGLSLLGLSGCGPAASTPPIVKDPAQSFKEFAESKISKIHVVEFVDVDGIKHRDTNTNFAYDVKRTDSLISPYRGEISFDRCRQFADEIQSGTRETEKYSLVYAYQEGHWVFQGYKSHGGSVLWSVREFPDDPMNKPYK